MCLRLMMPYAGAACKGVGGLAALAVFGILSESGLLETWILRCWRLCGQVGDMGFASLFSKCHNYNNKYHY